MFFSAREVIDFFFVPKLWKDETKTTNQNFANKADNTIAIVFYCNRLIPALLTLSIVSTYTLCDIAINKSVSPFLQSMNDENASLRRLLKYFIPVISFAVIFNIPKFFEAQLDWNWVDNSTQPTIAVTEFRLNEDYHMYYNTWLRLVVLGIIPFGMLVFFNTKIYQDIQVRSIKLYS